MRWRQAVDAPTDDAQAASGTSSPISRFRRSMSRRDGLSGLCRHPTTITGAR